MRTVVLLLVTLTLAAVEDAGLKSLADRMTRSVTQRDFVAYATCFPTKADIMAHFGAQERNDVTLAMVDQRFGDRGPQLLMAHRAMLVKLGAAGIDPAALGDARLDTRGDRPERDELNMLAVILEGPAGRAVTIRANDLIKVGDRWLVGEEIQLQVR